MKVGGRGGQGMSELGFYSLLCLRAFCSLVLPLLDLSILYTPTLCGSEFHRSWFFAVFVWHALPTRIVSVFSMSKWPLGAVAG